MSFHNPSYRLHKPAGQAVVTLDGRDFYLGAWRSTASQAEYDRLLAEWLANGRRVPTPPAPADEGPSINDLILTYVKYADGYYRKGGKPTGEADNVRYALLKCVPEAGHEICGAIGILTLQPVRGISNHCCSNSAGIKHPSDE